MSWRFRKSFKIFPGVRLNIGKKGITSATIGKRGLTTSIGKKGVFQNTGIPGTGLSVRRKLDGSQSSSGALIVLGIVGAIIVGVIVFCVMLSAIGRISPETQTDQPSKFVTIPTITPSPTATPTKTSQKKSRG